MDICGVINKDCLTSILFVCLFACFLPSGPPKLDLDLGSPVSSVSDPDVSGVSDEEPLKKRDKKVSVVKQEEDSKPFDENQSDGKKMIDLKARVQLTFAFVFISTG